MVRKNPRRSGAHVGEPLLVQGKVVDVGAAEGAFFRNFFGKIMMLLKGLLFT